MSGWRRSCTWPPVFRFGHSKCAHMKVGVQENERRGRGGGGETNIGVLLGPSFEKSVASCIGTTPKVMTRGVRGMVM